LVERLWKFQVSWASYFQLWLLKNIEIPLYAGRCEVGGEEKDAGGKLDRASGMSSSSPRSAVLEPSLGASAVFFPLGAMWRAGFLTFNLLLKCLRVAFLFYQSYLGNLPLHSCGRF
jgi:hypothetical protein